MNTQQAPAPTALGREPQSRENTRLRGHWLVLARIALLAITVLALVVYIAGTPANVAWLNSLHTDCLDICMTAATVQSLHALGIPITIFAVYWTSVNLLFALPSFGVAASFSCHKLVAWLGFLLSSPLLTLGLVFPALPLAL